MPDKGFLSLVLSLALHSAWAMYSPSDGITELTPSNFDLLVVQDNSTWVVEFYAPRCIHSQNLVDEYKTLAKALKGIVKVGSVDVAEHKSLRSQYGVSGVPTIKIFGTNKLTPTHYSGERTAEAIEEAALAEA